MGNRIPQQKVVSSVSTFISTDDAKFGAASALFDGNGNLSIASSDDFAFGTGNFTIEMFFKTGPARFQGLITLRGSEEITIYTGEQNNLACDITGLVEMQSPVFAYTQGEWNHVVIQRKDYVVNFYLNGNSVASLPMAITNFAAMPVEISSVVGGGRFHGYIDEVRISNVARYDGNFTVPTSQFVADDNTVLLLHMEGPNNSTVFTDDINTIAPPPPAKALVSLGAITSDGMAFIASLLTAAGLTFRVEDDISIVCTKFYEESPTEVKRELVTMFDAQQSVSGQLQTSFSTVVWNQLRSWLGTHFSYTNESGALEVLNYQIFGGLKVLDGENPELFNSFIQSWNYWMNHPGVGYPVIANTEFYASHLHDLSVLNVFNPATPLPTVDYSWYGDWINNPNNRLFIRLDRVNMQIRIYVCVYGGFVTESVVDILSATPMPAVSIAANPEMPTAVVVKTVLSALINKTRNDIIPGGGGTGGNPTSGQVIKFKRGEQANLPQTAAAGEPLFCTDTNQLFFGTGTGIASLEIEKVDGGQW